ncbi:MAG: glycosyltransferase [Caldilineaceae bacterium]|nr:glycosyltransferase [Caldilineaceae bacterium]
MRLLVLLALGTATYYITWRYFYSINWAFWPISLTLLAAETYSYLDTWIFGLGIWRLKIRTEAPAPIPGATVDVFITCYNEPVELVRETAIAARAITWPHRTFILDDGRSPAMQAMAAEVGVDYIVRSNVWQGKDRHAKAGNLVNALGQTTGEFILILDADQVPSPKILSHTLGYFRDPEVAFVQTPQWFHNTPAGNPFGTDAPLFYGPIQQSKDGWNAAYFCGSNAVLRREALMSIGIRYYVRDQMRQIRRAIQTADRLLRQAARDLSGPDQERLRRGIEQLRGAVREAKEQLQRGAPLQEVTWAFQREAETVSRLVVQADLAAIQAELGQIPGLEEVELGQGLTEALMSEETVEALAGREMSPLAAVTAVRALLLGVDLDRSHEAEAVFPIATISVTEDMATAMRMHATGWKSVYHHEILARGLAPEDLRTSLQQRLRWAQGTIQVMLRENPLVQKGLSFGQRLMYFATMWSYLSGFFSLIYLLAPVLYLFFGWTPVTAYSKEFFWHLVPFLVANQLLFIFLGWGLPTWRGQQYNLAMFPLWIQAVTSAVANVYFGHKLGFVVTPKSRQSGVFLNLVRPQLVMMGLIVLSVVYGSVRLALGMTDDVAGFLVNVFWSCYNLVMLSVVIVAATYAPPSDGAAIDADRVTAATVAGRVTGGSVR